MIECSHETFHCISICYVTFLINLWKGFNCIYRITSYIYQLSNSNVKDIIKINPNPSQPQYSTIHCTNRAPIRWNIRNFPRKKEKRAETRAKSKSSRCAFVLAAKPPCIDPATPTQTPDPPPWMTPSLPQKFPDPLHRRVPFLLSPLHGFAADSVSLDPNSIDRGRRRDPSLSLSLSRLSPEFSTWMIDGARRNNERERHNKAVSRLSALSDPRWWTR